MYRHIYTKSWYLVSFFLVKGFISSSQNELVSRSTLSIVTKINNRIHQTKKLYLCQRWKKKKTKCWLVAERKKNIINETFVPMNWEVLFILGCEVAPHKKKGFWEKGDSDNLNISLKSLCNSLSWIDTAWTEESSCFFCLDYIKTI